MDVSQYLEIFLDETSEHLQSLSDQLMILENEPENEDTINEIFRAAHSLKGMAGTMGYKRMQTLTHDMENVFSEVRNGKMKVSSHLIDVLFQALDALEEYKNTIQETRDEGTNDNEAIIKELQQILDEGTGAAPAKEEEPKKAENKEAEAPKEAAGEDGKWKSVKLHEHEITAMKEAIGKNSHVYGFTVYVQETCILKAARAFLVFKALEELGEIIISDPSVQDIEDEHFDFDFSVYVISESNFDQVKAAIMSVSEIDHTIGEEVTADSPLLAVADDAADAPESSAERPKNPRKKFRLKQRRLRLPQQVVLRRILQQTNLL